MAKAMWMTQPQRWTVSQVPPSANTPSTEATP